MPGDECGVVARQEHDRADDISRLSQALGRVSLSMRSVDAKAKGVDPRLVEQAKTNYRKAQALYDLDLNVKKSVEGMRPDVGDLNMAAKNPEMVNPQNFFSRVNNLYDSGRLHEALGEHGADELLAHANENLVRHKVILRNQAIAKTAAKIAGVGAVGGSAIRHLIQ